jgi:small subunit ribosomal protein S1
MSKETNSAEVLLNQNVAPEQFDWDSFESGLDADARKEKSDLEEIYNGSLNNLDDNDVLVGKVVRLTDKEAIVDINFKSEGVISLNEFRYNQGLKVGDEVEVMVDREKTKQVNYNYLTEKLERLKLGIK